MSDKVLVFGGSLGRAAKKTRMRPNEPPDPNDPIVDEQRRSVLSRENNIASWKDKLLGSFDNIGSSHEEEDFNLKEGDVSKEVVDGPVTKIDPNTDTRARGKFARLAVFADLGQPLVSKIMIDGRIQRVEYQSLPLVCFDCGWYGHNREICPYIFDQGTTSTTVRDHLPREMPEILKCVEEERL
ncbi:hypothetical protein Gogos_016959 [Gossypium gossypioides]|uniref:CCHC-type domain-containing protein n=1 Tax=Gossypium gossypioides TaxID=34282 RepID=A0A7J9B971_GOSGO|nr:hypothetical protein [Gossypium gossypioides]